MPEPIASPLFRQSELSAVSLSSNTRFIRYGVEYKLDMSEYNERMEAARNLHDSDIERRNFELITAEEFETMTADFMECTSSYEVIDEHGKMCGYYNNTTKTLDLYIRAVTINEQVYYCDVVDRSVYTYGGSILGVLSLDETEIISYDALHDVTHLITYTPRD